MNRSLVPCLKAFVKSCNPRFHKRMQKNGISFGGWKEISALKINDNVLTMYVYVWVETCEKNILCKVWNAELYVFYQTEKIIV